MCELDPKILKLKVYNRDYSKVSNEEMLDDVKRVAKLLNKDTVPYKEYAKYGEYNKDQIRKRIGNWHKVLAQAGLVHTVARMMPEEELLENLMNVWQQLGRQPAYTDMKQPLSVCSGKPYMMRFGSWMKALEKFIEYANSGNTHIQSLHIKENESKNKRKTPRDINWRLRFLILKRDNFKCVMCGRSPAKNPEVELHIDHIHPYSKDGETEFENLQTLCSVCNIGKSDLV